MRFHPMEPKQYKSEAILFYDNLEAYITLMGKGYNGNISLSKN